MHRIIRKPPEKGFSALIGKFGGSSPLLSDSKEIFVPSDRFFGSDDTYACVNELGMS